MLSFQNFIFILNCLHVECCQFSDYQFSPTLPFSFSDSTTLCYSLALCKARVTWSKPRGIGKVKVKSHDRWTCVICPRKLEVHIEDPEVRYYLTNEKASIMWKSLFPLEVAFFSITRLKAVFVRLNRQMPQQGATARHVSLYCSRVPVIIAW